MTSPMTDGGGLLSERCGDPPTPAKVNMLRFGLLSKHRILPIGCRVEDLELASSSPAH